MDKFKLQPYQQKMVDWIDGLPRSPEPTVVVDSCAQLSSLEPAARQRIEAVAAEHGVMIIDDVTKLTRRQLLGEDYDNSGCVVLDTEGRVIKSSGAPKARIVDHDILGNPIYDPTEIAFLNAPVPPLHSTDVPKDQPVMVVGDGADTVNRLSRLALLESWGASILGPNFMAAMLDQSIPSRFKPKPARVQTDADRLAMARAESKRLAKAEKLKKRGGK